MAPSYSYRQLDSQQRDITLRVPHISTRTRHYCFLAPTYLVYRAAPWAGTRSSTWLTRLVVVQSVPVLGSVDSVVGGLGIYCEG